MKEYRVRKGLRILIYILTSLVMVLYGGLTIALILPPFNTITEQMHASMPGLWLPMLFIVMIAFMIMAILSTKKRKIIITGESIISISLLGKRELKFEEIKGFNDVVIPRSVVKYIGVLSKESYNKKDITISNLIENIDDLKFQLTSSIENLDLKKIQEAQEKYQNEEKEILKNNDFGLSIEERQGKLKNARLTANILNGAGIVLAVWMFFFPKPYKYALIACIALPLITISVIKFWKGLIRIDAEKGSVYPSAIGAIIIPGIVLALRAILDFSIDDYSNIWLPSILIAVVLTAILIIGNKELSFQKGKEYFTILSIAVFIFAYGYGAVVTTNCAFDKSEPEMFGSQVLEKTISGGRKSTSYDLKLSPWGNKIEVEKVSVNSDLYNNLQVGDKVSVYRFKGAFDIPWIVVDYAR